MTISGFYLYFCIFLEKKRKEMGSPLRVRTRQSFGFGLSGTTHQHCYELAHMVPEESEGSESIEWTDDLMQRLYEISVPAIHLVEKINLHFSEQFCFRLTWPNCTGI